MLITLTCLVQVRGDIGKYSRLIVAREVPEVVPRVTLAIPPLCDESTQALNAVDKWSLKTESIFLMLYLKNALKHELISSS